MHINIFSIFLCSLILTFLSLGSSCFVRLCLILVPVAHPTWSLDASGGRDEAGGDLDKDLALARMRWRWRRGGFGRMTEELIFKAHRTEADWLAEGWQESDNDRIEFDRALSSDFLGSFLRITWVKHVYGSNPYEIIQNFEMYAF